MNSKMFRADKLKRNVSLPALAVGAGLMVAGAPAMAFNVDGIFTAGEGYTLDLALTGYVETTNAEVSGSLKIGRDGEAGDVYVLFDFGRQVNDNSYGAGEIGWKDDGAPSGKHHNFSDLLNSDKLEFSIGGQSIALDYLLQTNGVYHAGIESGKKKKKDNKNPPPDEITLDYIQKVATSLEFDVNSADVSNVGSPNVFDTSPIPPTSPNMSGDDVETRYDEITNNSDWEYNIIYEIQLNGEFFDVDDSQEYLMAIASDILGVPTNNNQAPIVHFSPNKLGKNKVFFTCVTDDKQSCGGIEVKTEINEPGTAAVFGFGLLGLGALQRRRRKLAKAE